MRIIIVLLILGICTPVFALTTQQEDYIVKQYELDKLKQERLDIISARDAELLIEDQKANTAKQTIMSTYETLIDAKEVEIDAKEGEFNSIINN